MLDEIKAILRRWGAVRGVIRKCTDDLKDIIDELDAVMDAHPQQLTGMPHSGQISNPTEQAVFRRMEMLDECRDRMRALLTSLEQEERFEREVEGLFIYLSSVQEAVIRDRYRSGMTQEEVAETLMYSDRHVRRIERDALKILEAKAHEESLL